MHLNQINALILTCPMLHFLFFSLPNQNPSLTLYVFALKLRAHLISLSMTSVLPSEQASSNSTTIRPIYMARHKGNGEGRTVYHEGFEELLGYACPRVT